MHVRVNQERSSFLSWLTCESHKKSWNACIMNVHVWVKPFLKKNVNPSQLESHTNSHCFSRIAFWFVVVPLSLMWCDLYLSSLITVVWNSNGCSHSCLLLVLLILICHWSSWCCLIPRSREFSSFMTWFFNLCLLFVGKTSCLSHALLYSCHVSWVNIKSNEKEHHLIISDTLLSWIACM
jgi:hypothetical protein